MPRPRWDLRTAIRSSSLLLFRQTDKAEWVAVGHLLHHHRAGGELGPVGQDRSDQIAALSCTWATVGLYR